MSAIRATAAFFACLFLTCTTFGQIPPSAADMMARVEGPQVPNRQGYDSYTIDEMMRIAAVPGVSVAVIQDFGSFPFAQRIRRPAAASTAVALLVSAKVGLAPLTSSHPQAYLHTETGGQAGLALPTLGNDRSVQPLVC
ncbi:MAG: hypothetical protein U0163_01000 [Gemmatimonadaceae bacterium]